jgi:hypothetical protein
MKASDIQDLFDLQNVLADVTGSVDAPIVTEPNVLAALLEWKRSEPAESLFNHGQDGSTELAAVVAPKAKRGKATESSDSDKVTSDEPDF